MRLTGRQRQRAAIGGAFGLPVAAVLVTVSLLNRDGPSAAYAGLNGVNVNAGIDAAHADQAAPAVRAAIDRIAQLRDVSFGPNPFFDRRSLEDSETPIPRLDDEIGVEVGLVMASARGNMALLDGKTHREGDIVEGLPWRVKSIDVVGRSVTFQHLDTGREVTVTVDGQ